MCVTWRVDTYRYAYEAELEAKRSQGSGAAAAPVEPVLFDTGLQPGGTVYFYFCNIDVPSACCCALQCAAAPVERVFFATGHQPYVI